MALRGWLLFGVGVALFSACGGEEFSESGGAAATGGGAGSAGDGGSGGNGGSGGSAGVGGSTSCSSEQKNCAGSCVPSDLPDYGCASTTCEPCEIPNATATCDDSGACAVDHCDGAFADCDGKPDNGCETDLSGGGSCVACAPACASAPDGAVALVCSAGTCQCADTRDACEMNSLTACIDLTQEPQACGGCATACEVGQWCQASTCVGPRACAFGLTRCSDTCVSTQSDPNNCGACGFSCEATLACKQGACVSVLSCTPPYAVCGAALNACTHPLLDSQHCGSCFNTCDARSACIAGTCQRLTLTNEAWMCSTQNGTQTCLVPNDWPESAFAKYFCAAQCPWGQAG